MGLTFDPTISITGAATTLAAFAASITFLIMFATRFNGFDMRIKGIETHMQKQTDILITLARVEERMTSMNEDIARISAAQHDMQVRGQIRGQTR